MELATTPMTERQRKYRENYRERVAGWYNGWLHILLIYTIGFTALYVYIANLHDVRWWEILSSPSCSCSPISSNGPCTAT
jgi:hypothetical protein